MAALTGNKIKDSYLGLLKTTDSGIFTANFIRISDGGGNGSQLYLSNTAIRFHNAYTFPNADGTSGQVLSTDGSGTLYFTESSDNQTLEEVLTSGNTATLAILSTADGNTFGSTTFDAAVTGTTANFTTSVTSPSFIGDIDGALIQQVKAAETLVKGDVVYISGGTGDNPEVSKAKADSSTTMAALGIIKNNIAEDDVGECITSGELTGLGTLLGSFATGDDLYVSATTAGALVTTAPTGVTNLIQKIGKVIKGGNGGALTVLGAFRVNASPNLPTGILLGDTTNVSTAITDGSVGQILSTDGSGSYSFIDNDEGTVTSVALSVPTGLTVTGSPITTNGTIAIGGTLGVANGGTGATTLTGILVGNGTSAISVVSDGIVSGQVLSTNANGTYSFIDAAGGDVSISGTPSTNEVAIWTNSNTIKGDAAFQFLTGVQNSIKLIRGTGAGNILFYAADGTTLHGYIENQVSGNGLVIGQRDGVTSAVIDLDDSTITFKTNNNPHLTISSGGNVGIGTSGTPTRKLQVLSGASSDIASFGNDSGSFTFGQSSALTSLDLATSNAFRIRQGSVVPLTISSGGNVGIGTNSPTVSQSGYGMEIGNNFQNAGIRFNAGTSGWGYTEYYHGSTAKFMMGYRQTDDSFRIRTGASLVSGNGLTISSGGDATFSKSVLIEGKDNEWGLNCRGGTTTSQSYGLLVKAGTSSSDYTMSVQSTSNTQYLYVRGDGYLFSSSSWSGSDRRLKENIINLDDGLNKVLALQPRKFDFIDGFKNEFGFIAQEVKEVIPEAVSVYQEENEMLAIKMDFIIPHLTKAIQEQQTIIEDLKARIETLEG